MAWPYTDLLMQYASLDFLSSLGKNKDIVPVWKYVHNACLEIIDYLNAGALLKLGYIMKIIGAVLITIQENAPEFVSDVATIFVLTGMG